MATVRNNAQHVTPLTGGYTMSPGEVKTGVNTGQPWETVLVNEGVLTVINASNPPAVPAIIAGLPGGPGLNQLLVTGNSYAEAQTRGADRFPLIAAQILGTAEFSYAKNGSCIVQNTDSAGWLAILNRIKPYKPDGLTLVDPTEGGEWVGYAGAEVNLLSRNMNDQALLGLANQDIFIEALRCEVVRMRTQVWWPVSSAGWTWGAGVGAQAAQAGSTDGPYRLLSVGATCFAQRATPAHFPGGMMHFMTACGGGTIAGGDYKVEVDGVQVDQTAFRAGYSALPTYIFPICRRFYVPAGAHTIKITCTGAGGATFPGIFFGMGFEANDGPLTILEKSHLLSPATVASWGANYDPSITLVQNAMMDALCAEFSDGLVKAWDMNVVMQGPNASGPLVDATDLLHPSRLGAFYLGTDLAKFIALNLPKQRRRRPDKWLHIGDSDGWYTGATIGAGCFQSAPGFNATPQFRRDRDGTVFLSGTIGITADPGAGVSKLLATLPEIFRPQAYEYYSCYGTDGTTKSAVGVLVGPDGTVTAYPTAAGTKLPFGGSSFISLSGINFKATK